MQLSLILLSVVGLVVSTPVEIALSGQDGQLNTMTKNAALENLILDLLEDLRVVMVTGSEENNIPVLDPFELEELRLDEEIVPLPGSQLTVKDLKVSKLSTFVTESLRVNIASIIPVRYRIDFEFSVPVLEGEAANYDLLAILLGVQIFGNGDASVNLIEPRVTGSVVVGPRVSLGSGLYLRISSADIKVSLKALESNINGLMNDPELSEFINRTLETLVPELLETYEAEISAVLNRLVVEIGNDLLADLDLSGIIGNSLH